MISAHRRADVAIIGAGPAGLAAATRLTATGLDTVLIDAGPPVAERLRDNPHHATHGHGGAGLFSDGKFSFYPSASSLWSLPHTSHLHAAYTWTTDILNSAGLTCPPFPEDPQAYTPAVGSWVLKDYPSTYLPLEHRLRLTAGMVNAVDAEALTGHQVTAIAYDRTADAFRLDLLHGETATYRHTRRLLVATGRFGPLALAGITSAWRFHRLEVGLRIQQPAHRAFFRTMAQLDPKLRFRDPDQDIEWRTFCACRNAETVTTETQGLWTVSGRADCPPTGHSNTGFNLRITDEALAEKVLAPLLGALSDPASAFALPLSAVRANTREALNRLDEVYGADLRHLIVKGLANLTKAYPALNDPDTQLIGPTLEGIGRYPELDGALRIRDIPAWVAGDATGLFRGIVASMISGHYAAATMTDSFSTQRETQ